VKILQFCVAADKFETGGILVGHYSKTHDVAHVSDASGPPKDSKSGTTWFRRGLYGMQKWLLRLWKDDHFYLSDDSKELARLLLAGKRARTRT